MKPSKHYRKGECGFCHASGSVTVLVPPPAHQEPCPVCHGSGVFPPREEVPPEVIQRAKDLFTEEEEE
jgi:DnaJ-class molecular chaperone